MAERIIYKKASGETALRQGEILTNVIQYKPIASEISLNSPDFSFDVLPHPFVIVVSQDCDLDWDYKARQPSSYKSHKLLNSIIFCRVSTAQETRTIDAKSGMNSKEWKLTEDHRHERYYFFEKIPNDCDLQAEGLPELTADFKIVFGLDSETIYRQIELGIAKRRTILSSPYLEHFSKRFYNFHGRIALPFQYESEKEG
ncbi:MAG: hypothetical protein GPJ08_14315 [Microcystis aeruginosa G13-09]|jgi:hypothetical protein|nr:hypothetical protein [Microcystis aeruginosa G13-09]